MTFDDLIKNRRNTMSLGPFEKEATRMAHDLKGYAKESGPSGTGFRRPFSKDLSGVEQFFDDMGPMDMSLESPLKTRDDKRNAPKASGRFRAELGLPSEVMTDEGVTSVQGEMIIIDLESGDMHYLPLDTSTSMVTIPDLGEIQRSHDITGSGKFLEIIDPKGQTVMMPIEEDELYSNFMDGSDVDLTRGIAGKYGGDIGDVSYDKLSNIHSGKIGGKVRDEAARVSSLSMSDAEMAALEGGGMTAGSMESPYDTTMDYTEAMDDLNLEDTDLINTLDEFGTLDDVELASVAEGLSVARMMLESNAHRPADEYVIELIGRKYENGLRQYVYEVGHPQMGKYHFKYQPDFPDLAERMQVERKA